MKIADLVKAHNDKRLSIVLGYLLDCFESSMSAEQASALSKVDVEDMRKEFERLKTAVK